MASSLITKFAHLQIPLEDVLNATSNFHHDNVIGRGGLGHVYKGHLQSSGEVAALRLDHHRHQGEQDLEFWTEISMLSDLKHTNIVSLVGFCYEKHEKIIVTLYEAKNGSLQEHLSNPNLTWTQRLKICLGVARALSYLHHDEGRGYGVIHLNVNSSSITLDENWEPKLSGFKVSIKQSLNRTDQVVLSEPIGTPGYMDPEIVKNKGVTHKSDIYSFGVVLFEILCGRKAYVKNQQLLAQLARDHYENGTLHEIVHPDLRDQISPYQISVVSFRKCSKTAYSCLMEDRAFRPDMLNVVDELEKALKLAFKFHSRPQNFGKQLEHLKIQLDDIKVATENFSDTYKVSQSSLYTWYAADLGHLDKGNHPSSATHNFSDTYKVDFSRLYPWYTADSNHFDKAVPLRTKSKIASSVVIKRFLPENDNHEEEFFFTELEVLTSIKHHNIVTLIGFCVEGFEMILVTEKLPNRYLSDYLGSAIDACILSWENRLKICIDVARALVYLHSETNEKQGIVHNYISSTRFALDENWGAKIEDFELAVFLPPNTKDEMRLWDRTCYELAFYVDPEYVKSGKPKTESDVYSFGVVLFEILCGRHTYEKNYHVGNDKGLAHVARRKFHNGTIEDMIDPTLKEKTTGANKYSLHTFINIAHRCVEESQDQRPTMKVVLKELKRALFFQEERVLQLDKDNGLEIATQEIPEEVVHSPDTEASIKFKAVMVEKLEHLRIPLTQIQSATNNFSETYLIKVLIDGHSFYKADIEHYDKENPSCKRHNTVIIKRYPSGDGFYKEKHFLKELTILCDMKHPNIVNLLGFCLEASEMILIIDNFSNGFLGDYLISLKDKRVLTWEKRLKICIDVAHALRHIHNLTEYQIINRDIWSYNIGLNENLGAKIVDFGFSEFLTANQEDEARYLKWIGRQAYTDPEYKSTDKLKRESDVYSLGIVLLEILCGKLGIYFNEDVIGLAHLVRQSFWTGMVEGMIDPTIKEEKDINSFVLNRGPNKDSLHTFIEIARKCLAETQDQRPTMEVVVKELEKALFFQENNMDNPKMSLELIQRATQNFHKDNCIGGGGFGSVFKGKIQDNDGFKTIVAKRLDTKFGQGEQQFLSELQILLDYKHENVIGLIGYCDENHEKVIVYEYLSRGSLDRYLNDTSLTWVKRLNICIDVANALDFLHGGVGKQSKVIHRDIKTENILLNDDWKAKLADFGLSLICSINQESDHIIDHVCGTRGYVDPLYGQSGFLTIESDIYSFGVVLFEILCGRSTFTIHKHVGHYLPDFIKNNFEEGKHVEVVFNQIREQIVPKSLTTFQMIAYRCLHHEREKRPTMKEVLKELNKALEFQVHPLDRDEEGCSGPNEDTQTETLGVIQQLSNKYSETGQQVQETEQDLVSPGSKQRVLEYLKQEVILGEHQEEGVHNPNTKTASELLSIQALSIESMGHLMIPLTHIQSATNNFSETYLIEVLNDGHSLYRADIEHYDKENPSRKKHGTAIIKRYPSGDGLYGKEQFLKELTIVGIVKHPNIATLLGFCLEASEMILVIDNFSNGFLGDYLLDLKDKRVLTWEKRLKICIDVAHALMHIHFKLEQQAMIINRDIWSYNISLDENLGAKIVHFWWSEILDPNKEHEAVYRNWISRRSYKDPEYERTRKLTREVDVYSFGIVLFEILCGRLCFDSVYLKESDNGLVDVARQSFRTGTLEDMIDPIIKEVTDDNNFVLNRGPNKYSLHLFTNIAHKCLAETHDQRPTMNVVIKELEKALFFQVHSLDKDDEEGCSGPKDEAETETVGVLRQQYSKTGKLQVQETETYIPPRRSKQIVLENLKQEVIPEEGVHQPSTLNPSELLIPAIRMVKLLKHLMIPLTQIQSATNNFSETCLIEVLIDGHSLYRADIELYDEKNPSRKRHDTVIIKRYPSGDSLYKKEQFLKEFIALGTMKHPNIVNLLGFCLEASEMILVIDNFSNGFLGDYLLELKDKRVLTWEKRLKICIDVAHALMHIHSTVENPIKVVNRDIWSYNISLDENLGAKIVHFWWSEFQDPNEEPMASHRKWTGRPYYRDPEYERTRKLKRESDVYSFGIVLFEILCGRLCIDSFYLKESDKRLAHIARQSFWTRTPEDMIDPIIKEATDNKGPNTDSLRTFIAIAHKCMAKTQDQRPTMNVVVNELEKALFFHSSKISLEEMKRATQNFHNDNCIGRGGFGRFYKGNIQDGDGFKTIVAKRLDTRFDQGQQQFLSELQILLDYKHENVIGLVGYCDENDEKIIIYEYASRGSLDMYLNDTSLTWVKRLNICIDVARALDFLHGGVGKQAKVIHRDIKTENIMLNDDWKAKLADFRLSLIWSINQEKDYIIDHVCGTRAYVDPLYTQSGFLTIESDIYSFGVVLFEILCGRSTYEIYEHEGHYLPDFIKKRFEEGKHDEVVLEQIREQIIPESLTTFQEIAYQCLHYEREKRPTIREVLTQLKKALHQANASAESVYCWPCGLWKVNTTTLSGRLLHLLGLISETNA